MKNNARISYSERKQLGRSQNIKHAKVFIVIVKNYLNVEFIEVPLGIIPEISRFYGIIIYMYINDHNPPHFHVWYNEYEAVITIDEGIVIGSLPRRELKLVYEWLDIHKEELLENWRLLSNSELANKIEPLE